MKVTLERQICLIEREPHDPVFRNGGYGSAESRLLYHVKQALQKQGYDVIKKRMWKDGHMYGDDTLQYIRTRNKKIGFMLYDSQYAVRCIAKQFNTEGKVTLFKEEYKDGL